ncbi:hypothetical protein EV189_1400 [Motilibacter rhizosphaerae]|uniref:Uncharacterized protein n=1 Tax=Motilibacter rhizosphaerae TaxID=598652 RepID=A0A4Q7NRG4_9ACTN|nr:hypothetical protein [Motilibacter rhizosphaerae]RZS89631.1 hypothetical protein EV189_1400 [Motilibacter rhizosphaerae]
MPRLGSTRPADGTPAFTEVVVRQANAPQLGWTEEQALDLLRQGYSVEHTARRTGFDARWLAAQLAPLGRTSGA